MRATLLIALLVAGMAVVGCSDPSGKNAQVEGSLSVDERIKKIEDTPGMPDEQKAQAIEALKSHTGGPPKPPQ